jgi:hypothetical protein
VKRSFLLASAFHFLNINRNLVFAKKSNSSFNSSMCFTLILPSALQTKVAAHFKKNLHSQPFSSPLGLTILCELGQCLYPCQQPSVQAQYSTRDRFQMNGNSLAKLFSDQITFQASVCLAITKPYPGNQLLIRKSELGKRALPIISSPLHPYCHIPTGCTFNYVASYVNSCLAQFEVSAIINSTRWDLVRQVQTSSELLLPKPHVVPK